MERVKAEKNELKVFRGIFIRNSSKITEMKGAQSSRFVTYIKFFLQNQKEEFFFAIMLSLSQIEMSALALGVTVIQV